MEKLVSFFYSKELKKFTAFLICLVIINSAFGQTAEEFKTKFSEMYGIIFGIAFYLLTELGKIIKPLSNLPVQLISVIVGAVGGIIAAVIGGIPPFEIFSWIGIITFIYNTIFGAKKALSLNPAVTAKKKDKLKS